jgi:hypothetical protein
VTKTLLILAILAAAGASSVEAGAVMPVAPCRTAQLSVRLGQVDGGVGHFGTYVFLTNRSAAACVVQGYLGFRLLDAKRRPMPTRAAHGSTYLNGKDPGPKPVVLLHGGRAKAFVEWSQVPTGNEPVDRACEPDSAYLRVTPPGTASGIVVRFRQMVCGHGGMLTSALRRA